MGSENWGHFCNAIPGHGSVCRGHSSATCSQSIKWSLFDVATPCPRRNMPGFPAQSPVPSCQWKPSSSLIAPPPPPARLRHRASRAGCNQGAQRGTEKGRERQGSSLCSRISWGNNDPVKCHLLFPQGIRMVPFQQQGEGGHHCKAILGGGKAQNSPAPGKALSKQDIQNVYVKGL